MKEFVNHCEENMILWKERLAQLQGASGSGSSTGPSTILRPVPLTKPILQPMTRYAKTVFPLSLPSLEARMPPLASKLANMSPWAALPPANSPSSTFSNGPISPTHGTTFSASSSGTSLSSSSSTCTVWENPNAPTVQEVRDSVKVGWEKRLKRKRSFRRASVDHSGRRLGPVGLLPSVITTGV